jgi:hypothetical protein
MKETYPLYWSGLDFWKIEFEKSSWTNFIFTACAACAACAACKIQVQNRQKIKFVQLDFSKIKCRSIFKGLNGLGFSFSNFHFLMDLFVQRTTQHGTVTPHLLQNLKFTIESNRRRWSEPRPPLPTAVKLSRDYPKIVWYIFLGGLQVLYFLAVGFWVTWFISSWERNNTDRNFLVRFDI